MLKILSIVTQEKGNLSYVVECTVSEIIIFQESQVGHCAMKTEMRLFGGTAENDIQ